MKKEKREIDVTNNNMEDMVAEVKIEAMAVEETRTTMVHKTRMEETEVEIITTMVVIMAEETIITVLRMITTIRIWFKNPKLKEKDNLFQSLLPNQLKLKNLK